MTDKTLQERLREYGSKTCCSERGEAADALDSQAERIETMKLAVEVAVAERDAAQERIKALEGDAERYRWLRDEYWDFNVDTHGIWDSDSTQLDATIDRARALLGEK